ncbi:MAG TPA: hypothetical protein VF666_04400 [Pyrinomonadaceae bacterium]|jgi:hypothetical protein
MTKSSYIDLPPTRRPLKIFAFDPMLGRAANQRITIEIANEPDLQIGPRGSRVEVIDYDGANKCYYTPVDLNAPGVLMRGGLDPNESVPCFHQQMVYAVAMKVIENFERALGRRISFRYNQKLRIFPHAFQGANAFYDPDSLALFFGYFQADKLNPGPNLPGQTVFTCLSHDIIAHEMTHALVDRLRKYFIEPSNRDVSAFHEGFSDIVAIFQHFSFPDILRGLIQETRSDLRSPTPLIELAREFGYATGQGRALRSAVDTSKTNGSGGGAGAHGKPDPRLYESVFEPHERGSILVSAVFEAFFNTYQKRIKDLIRIATGGTGQLPAGDLHPDLVNRIAAEASSTAQSILTMCIRAFEYLPPVDITFGDYLRALVTADFELSPADENGERAAMIEAFRERGIYPDNVTSLAEESLIWESAEGEGFPDFEKELIDQLVVGAQLLGRSSSRDPFMAPPSESEASQFTNQSYDSTDPAHDEYGIDLQKSVKEELARYARDNAVKLGLCPGRKITVRGFHPAFRVGADGQLLIEMVAQFTQRDDPKANQDFGGVPVRGGTTVIASAEGKVRYVISKPLYSKELSDEKKKHAQERIERQLSFVDECDRADPHIAWYGSTEEKEYRNRIARTMNFAAVHRGIRR